MVACLGSSGNPIVADKWTGGPTDIVTYRATSAIKNSVNALFLSLDEIYFNGPLEIEMKRFTLNDQRQ